MKMAWQMIMEDIKAGIAAWKELPKSEATKELIGLIGITVFILILCML